MAKNVTATGGGGGGVEAKAKSHNERDLCRKTKKEKN
jgi:hypothetical protein